MFLNYKVPQPESFVEIETSSSIAITENMRIALDPQMGKLAVAADDSLNIRFAPFERTPRWIELSVSLPFEKWRRCRTIFVAYTASGSGIEVRPALRFANSSGFNDCFGPETHLVGEERSSYSSEFAVYPRFCQTATRIDLHLFFTPCIGLFRLWDLCLTAVE